MRAAEFSNPCLGRAIIEPGNLESSGNERTTSASVTPCGRCPRAEVRSDLIRKVSGRTWGKLDRRLLSHLQHREMATHSERLPLSNDHHITISANIS